MGNLAPYLPGRGRRGIKKPRGLGQWLILHLVGALAYHLPSQAKHEKHGHGDQCLPPLVIRHQRHRRSRHHISRHHFAPPPPLPSAQPAPSLPSRPFPRGDGRLPRIVDPGRRAASPRRRRSPPAPRADARAGRRGVALDGSRRWSGRGGGLLAGIHHPPVRVPRIGWSPFRL